MRDEQIDIVRRMGRTLQLPSYGTHVSRYAHPACRRLGVSTRQNGNFAHFAGFDYLPELRKDNRNCPRIATLAKSAEIAKIAQIAGIAKMSTFAKIRKFASIAQKILAGGPFQNFGLFFAFVEVFHFFEFVLFRCLQGLQTQKTQKLTKLKQIKP